MSSEDRGSAEEFFSRCVANVAVLDRAARRHAAEGDAVSAVAAAWGADVNAAQSVLWERIMVASTAPQHLFFRAAEALIPGLAVAEAGVPSNAMEAVGASRRSLLDACDASLRREIQRTWPEISYLAGLPAPTGEDLVAAAAERLDGVSPARFAKERYRMAHVAMREAHEYRVRGDSAAAIQGAYDSDFLALEGYLVESAAAAGDVALLSVVARWDLATGAVTDLAGLPEEFAAAVAVIREALCRGLGEADAGRVREAFAPA